MIDAEVLRLRRLRDIALRTRALGKFLDSDPDSESDAEHSVFARSAVACWTVARIATGRLRAHPYLSYQRGPSQLRSMADRLFASLLGLSAQRSDRPFSVYGEQLQAVAREVDDARALTWSPDLSDALGRMQIQIRRLVNELELGAHLEAGGTALPRVIAAARHEPSSSLDELAVETSWPYLAI
jgi:hypothetical protein